MKKYLIALLLVCNSYIIAASWNITASTINKGTSTGAIKDVTLAYFPKNKTVVAAWVDEADTRPWYSVYNGTSWSTGQPFFPSNPITARNNVNLQSFPFVQRIVAAWGDASTADAYYSLFDGTSWTTPALIDPINSPSVGNEINMAYDKLNRFIVAAWSSSTIAPQQPVYSILHSNLTWDQVSPLAGYTQFQVYDNINLVYNKTSQQIVAAWQIENGSSPGQGAIYDVFDSVTQMWAGPQTITMGGTDGVYDDVHLISYPTSSLVLAFWGNYDGIPANDRRPAVASYDGVTFNVAGFFAPAALTGCTSGVVDNVGLGVDINTLTGFIAYGCKNTAAPVYVTVQLPSTFTGGAIPMSPSNGVKADVNLKYDQKSPTKMIAAWADTSDGNLYFNTYQ